MNLLNTNHLYELIKENSFKRILLAVSGGLDSICLAHYFICNKNKFNIDWIGISHVHHGLRESSADLDAKLVEKFAKYYNVPFFIKYLNGNELKNEKGSLEENARNKRYDFLQLIANNNNVNVILTAHHAKDKAETLYLRLYRGTTLAGLRAILELRDFNKKNPIDSNKSNNNIQILRPFINVHRNELYSYAIKNKLEWREDESNSDIKFFRNHIRHVSLPYIESKNPNCINQLIRIANLAEHAYNKIISTTDKLFKQTIIPNNNWPFLHTISPYKKVIALNLNLINNINESFSKNSNDSINLCELFRLWLDFYGFRFPLDTFTNNKNKFIIENTHYKTRFIEKCRKIVWIYDKRETKSSLNLYFDIEKQRFSQTNGYWRYPQNDDVLWPLDGNIHLKPLKQWLREKSVPNWIHSFLKVFAQESRILYVSGISLKQKKDSNE